MRRLVTMVPAFIVIAIGVDPSRTLVLSQVVLSFGIPFALVPLVDVHAPPRHHGRARQPAHHDGRRLRGRARDLGLNIFLLAQTVGPADARPGGRRPLVGRRT